MPASYPTSIKSFSAKTDLIDDVMAVDVNEIQDEVAAIETELGTLAKGSAATVKARLEAIELMLQSGWVPESATWTYASATSFTVSGDQTGKFQKGTKIKLTQTTTKHFVVTNSVYGAPNTTVTITGGSDYSLANAAIASPCYSYIESPQGYPQSFAYTPTGIAASNVTLSGRFSVRNRRCFVDMVIQFTGGITFTTMPTLPIPAATNFVSNVAPIDIAGVGAYKDAGIGYVVGGVAPNVSASGTTVRIVRTPGGEAMSATSPITWANEDAIILRFSYDI